MPRLDHANIGEVQKTAYLTGTITTVDSENDTASFTGIGKCPAASGIPIFYHCEPDSEQRSNGALEGAAGAFAEDDEVIVQCEIKSDGVYEPLYVMGFVDKPKVCEFYIDITVNGFTPSYYKTIKLIDNDGIVHIKQSSSEEPAKAGPFRNVVFPARVYLYHEGNAPIVTDDSRKLFSYFAENPVKEFTVKIHTDSKDNTITIDGILLGAGDQQKFRWDYDSKTWSPVSGGVDDNTTLFMAHKMDPTSTGFGQACKKEVVNACEGVVIRLSSPGNPQTMGEIYDYCFSAKRVYSSFHSCETYNPYYGLVENLPDYDELPHDTVTEDLYYMDAWRVAYLLTDDDTINGKPKDPINFTAFRLGSLKTKDTVSPDACDGCDWTVEEKTWYGDIDDIKYHEKDSEYLLVAIRTIRFGYLYWEMPYRCEPHSAGPVYCGAGGGGNIIWGSWVRKKIGTVVLPQMGIMTDSDGKNPVFEETTLTVDHFVQETNMQVVTSEGEWVSDICYTWGSNPGAKQYEFKMLSTPEHRI